MPLLPIVYFVTPDYILDRTPIEKNVDQDKIVPFIITSQDIHIQSILGSLFYDHLKDGVSANTLNNDEIYLIRNYIQPCVANWVFYESYISLNYKVTNKSVAKERSEYSEPLSLDELKYSRSAIRTTAEYYSKRLQKYMIDYNYLFPLYNQTTSKDNVIKQKDNYFNSIYMPSMKTSRKIPIWDEPYFGENCDEC
jgi:hypothetical protein